MAMEQYGAILFSHFIFGSLIVAQQTSVNSKFEEISVEHPIHLVIPLPESDDFMNGKNPFLFSSHKVKPLADLALERVYQERILPNGSVNLIYRDSKLSDAIGPNVAVEQLLKKKLDCIIGYAYGYALAPVARMSPFWGNGIPIITPIGLTMSLDDKKEYQLMTRINSPYKVVSNAVSALFKSYDWKRHIFMFHHAKSPTIAVGECFLLMASLQHPLRTVSEIFKPRPVPSKLQSRK
uniref:ANF_receptor domain-containing protein n=1 Tax=Caenorhabditis japonica TaxID=281687 RepID=A0A8R1E3U3_CAEJA